MLTNLPEMYSPVDWETYILSGFQSNPNKKKLGGDILSEMLDFYSDEEHLTISKDSWAEAYEAIDAPEFIVEQEQVLVYVFF